MIPIEEIRKIVPDIILDEFPKELNPELYATSIDWEAEEKRLQEEKIKSGKSGLF